MRKAIPLDLRVFLALSERLNTTVKFMATERPYNDQYYSLTS